MKKLLILTFLVLFGAFDSIAQDTGKKITDYVNKEILIDNGWTGESITLVEEGNDYFVIRKFFGSGIPVTNVIKYSVNFNSEFQIEFSKIVEKKGIMKEPINENFRVSVEENGISVYLNEVKLVTKISTLPNTK